MRSNLLFADVRIRFEHMTSIPDFDDAETRTVEAALVYRYGRIVPMQSAEVDLKLDRDSDELTSCPALYWHERGCQFVICKLAPGRYRCEFFYSDQEHFGTGREEYTSLEQCATTLLQLQADHEKERAGVHSGASAADLDRDYLGPHII
jgi:hypothetical protein